MSKTVIFCHGFGGHSGYLWFKPLIQELEQSGVKCISPDFPDAKNPRYIPWRDCLAQVIQDNAGGNDLYLIAHSMGGYLVLRYLAENSEETFIKSIKGAILVGAAATKRPEYKPFYDEAVDWPKLRTIPTMWIIIHSRDDTVVPPEHPALIVQQLRATRGFIFLSLDGFDHFITRDLPQEVLTVARGMVCQ